MLRSTLRNEIALTLRHGMLSIDEVERTIETGHAASFLRRAPAPAAPASFGGNGRPRDAPIRLGSPA
jgi:hypothetical protein